MLPRYCILLAAGASTRMGRPKLLLPFANRIGSFPTMVQATLALVLAAGLRPILVTGRNADKVQAAAQQPTAGQPAAVPTTAAPTTAGQSATECAAPAANTVAPATQTVAPSPFVIVENHDWAQGMVLSIQAGLRAMLSDRAMRANCAHYRRDGFSARLTDGGACPSADDASSSSPEFPGFFIHHADMPLVDTAVFETLGRKALAEAALAQNSSVRRPLHAAFRGRMGHPVYVPDSLIPAILDLPAGERIKPFLLAAGGIAVETDCAAVLVDIDTPEDYSAYVQSNL